MIYSKRMMAKIDGDFVVFMIGMRVNNPLLVHRWWPVAKAMPGMIKELYAQPERGFLHAEMWFSRTTIMLQYWRSMDHLLAYAKDKDAQHLPAWRAFNKAVGTQGTVGIWHETYVVKPGQYENIYVNMPRFGLARAGDHIEVSPKLSAASERMNQSTATID